MTSEPTGVRRRRLIVNADDFGQSAGINAGVARCHEEGILTSASLMVRWPHAAAAAAYARSHAALSVGLHIDLGEWAFVDGEWIPLYQVVARDDAAAVKAEIEAQLDTFRRLMDRDPTHLDSHQNVHRTSPCNRVVADVAGRLRLPVRGRGGAVSYLGAFYGQTRTGERCDGALTVERLIDILRALPEGVTELGCHPGLNGDAPGMYVEERGQEVEALCDPRVRKAIEESRIDLISFARER